jgi:hypothetical protein
MATALALPVAALEKPPLFLSRWLETQAINAGRHAGALRPFQRGEFGEGEAAPTAGHLESANALIQKLRKELIVRTKLVGERSRVAAGRPEPKWIHAMLEAKEAAHTYVRAIEKIWDFYLDIFGQRNSRYAEWLVSCDWIALDCYQDIYMNLGNARSVPAPGPFSYMRTGFSPATYRRGIPLTALGKQINPFPLIELPYHRLINPWTLGAVLHEVSHNLQNDLGLQDVIPRNLARQLLKNGFPAETAKVWARWNRETYADLSGLLLGGPAVVASLMDVVGRSPESVVSYNPAGVHPTPYIRVFLSIELLRRMGFPDESRTFERMWTRMYPNPAIGSIPAQVLKTMREAVAVVVNTICYTPYPSIGGKSLAEVIPFTQRHQRMIEEAAGRVAKGTDPGIVPERLIIGAARVAIDRGYAKPSVIAENFYRALTKK